MWQSDTEVIAEVVVADAEVAEMMGPEVDVACPCAVVTKRATLSRACIDIILTGDGALDVRIQSDHGHALR